MSHVNQDKSQYDTRFSDSEENVLEIRPPQGYCTEGYSRNKGMRSYHRESRKDDERYSRHRHHRSRHKSIDDSAADKTLRDLRERLINKRRNHTKDHRRHDRESGEHKSEEYIKEIIEISSDSRHERKQKDYKSKSTSEGEQIVSVSDDSEQERLSSERSEGTEISSPNYEKTNSLNNRNRSRSRSNSCDSEGVENEDEAQDLIDELPPYFPAIQGCRSVEEFQCLNRIEEGTYGVVYRARDKRSEEIVALKRLKMEKEKEGFPITSLREINTLLKGQHPNIVTVREIVVGSNMDKIFIVMDYVEHDLKSLMETMRNKKQNFLPGEIKCLLMQLLKAVGHLHDNWILHRDLKTSNLLLSHKGILKVGDFGLAREYGSPLKAYTPIVVTLWYRAPELLLCTKEYSTPIDMWSVGCIFAELLLMNVLFPGKSEVDQLTRVFKDLGTPSEKIWPGFNELPAVKKIKLVEYPIADLKSKFSLLTDMGLEFLLRFLTYDPGQRITAEEAMSHQYFEEQPLPIDPSMFPTWPAKSELGQKRAMAASPKPPSGGGEYKKLKGDDDNFGFRLTSGESYIKDTSFNLKF